MSYYDSNGFVMPAKDADVVAWYRNKPAPFPDIPPCSKSHNYGRSWQYHFSEEEREQVRDRQRQKKHVLEALKLNAGLRGPFNTEVRERWFKDCSLKRKMIQHVKRDLAEGKGDPFEHARHLEEYRKTYRRTIALIRDLRCGQAPQWSPLCEQPFYVEPNCNHVPFDELKTAEANGVTFHRVYITVDAQLFFRLQRRFRVAGRISGYWSDQYDVDDAFSSHQKDKLVRCMFAFSDPAEAEKLEEEMVWIKMRF